MSTKMMTMMTMWMTMTIFFFWRLLLLTGQTSYQGEENNPYTCSSEDLYVLEL